MRRVGDTRVREGVDDRRAGGFRPGAAAWTGLRRLLAAAGLVDPAPESDFDVEDRPRTPDDVAPSARRPVELRDLPPVSFDKRTSDQSAGSHLDDVERLVARVAGAGALGRARRVLVTHAPSEDAPLDALDCAAFASDAARALAQEGRAILVVFGGGEGGGRPGLSELIEGSASFSEAIHRETGSRLHILPSGQGRAAPGSGLDVVLEALSATYDFVVLSAGGDDRDGVRRLAIALAPRADHVLLGCAGQPGQPDAAALRDALRAAGAGEVTTTRLALLAPAESREAA